MMPKITMRIEIVRSSFKHISSLSEKSAIDIIATLSKHYSDVTMTNVDNTADLAALIARKPDLVFAGIYHVSDAAHGGAKVWLADELEKNDIAHTGSGKSANRLSLNKHLAKQRLIECGIQTAAFSLARRSDATPVNEGALRFPLFVKPSNKSGGQGVDEFSIVRTTAQLQSKVQSIHTDELTDAIIEEYLEGREYSIAVMGNVEDDTLTAMPLELVATKDINGERMLGNVIKNLNIESSYEVTNAAERLVLESFAIDAFRALGARGYGRIDVRLDGNGVPNFLEANLIPGLIGIDNYFPKACRINQGMDNEAMIMKIVELALSHEPKLPAVAL